MTQHPDSGRVRILIPQQAYATPTPAARLAQDLAVRLRTGLAAAGFEVDRDFPHLRGDTTASDEPFLTLGRLRPHVVEQLLGLL